MKILLIRFSSIGDIVLCSPVVRWLQKAYPQAEIHFLCKKNMAGLLESHPRIHKVWPLNRFSETAPLLKSEGFDLIVDLHKNLRSFRFRWHLQASKVVSFKKLSVAKYLAVRFKQRKYLPNKHLLDRYAEGLEKISVFRDDEGLEFYGATKPSKFDEWPKPYAVIVAGAAHKTKQLTDSLILKITAKSDLPLLVIGAAADDRPLFKEKAFINLCGACSLHESAYVLQHAEKVYTSDTGMMHIAAAFKKELHVFWGNTIPEFGMYPYQSPHKNHEVPDLPCRPCSKIGFDACPKGHFDCMEKQEL